MLRSAHLKYAAFLQTSSHMTDHFSVFCLVQQHNNVILKCAICMCVYGKAEFISLELRADKRGGMQRSCLLCTAPRLQALILPTLQSDSPHWLSKRADTHTHIHYTLVGSLCLQTWHWPGLIDRCCDVQAAFELHSFSVP